MKKNNINSQSELLSKMNELNDGNIYMKQHLSEIFLEKETQTAYLYALERVFGLPENTLIKMADTTNVSKKKLKKGR
jgi:hypothetical protein